MTWPRGELTIYRVRGGHATDWANPTRSKLTELTGVNVYMWRLEMMLCYTNTTFCDDSVTETQTHRVLLSFLLHPVYTVNIYQASRPSQGTVNGGAISKWPRCWRDVKHKQTINIRSVKCRGNHQSFRYIHVWYLSFLITPVWWKWRKCCFDNIIITLEMKNE